MRAFKVMIVGAVFSALAGCGADRPVPAPEGPSALPEVRAPLPTDGSLQTDKATYTATCQGESSNKICAFTMVVTFTNRTSEPVYLDYSVSSFTVPYHSVRGLTEAGSAYNPNWAGCCPERVEVLPGEAQTDTLELSGPNSYDSSGELAGGLEGRMQLLYEPLGCADQTSYCPLPGNAGISNVFTVNLPD